MNASLQKIGWCCGGKMSQENSAVAESPKSANLKSVLMKKVGMTRIFDSNGNHVPVTVLAIESAKIVQVKTKMLMGTPQSNLHTIKKEKSLFQHQKQEN